ncbi:unnamed protein product, partial [Amoebophrya sp. A120]|eukprot:GSA120T00001019001.1
MASTTLAPPTEDVEEDYVGHSFWLITGIQLACSLFFALQVFFVPRRWVTPMIVAALVCFVAWHHYLYMAEEWEDKKKAPTVLRYMDWFITVPMQTTCFYLILAAATPADKPPVHVSLGLRLGGSSVLMLIFGYMGETDIMD